MLENMDGMYPEDLESYAEILRLGREYALTKARAMRARARGEIPSALALERLCDEIYQQLPPEGRW
jgi:hypothetical protein